MGRTNHLLQLKGRINPKRFPSDSFGVSLPTDGNVQIDHLKNLLSDLKELEDFWSKNNKYGLTRYLIGAYYTGIVAKSHRIHYFFCESTKVSSNDSIVGAKYEFENGIPCKHIITHAVKPELLSRNIRDLEKCISLFEARKITQVDNAFLKSKIGSIGTSQLSKTTIKSIIVDSFYLERFSLVTSEKYESSSNAITSLYSTGDDACSLLNKIGIRYLGRMIDNTTFLLNPDELLILQREVPYLIAMTSSDICDYSYRDENCLESGYFEEAIPKPSNEPTIGMIDTLFDDRVYFSEWVSSENRLSPDIPIQDKDYWHATRVASILVDGPHLNPNLDDGCGHFKVRHFGVATAGLSSSFTIMKEIQQIVVSNPDIKVWNLSLGSKYEINREFISPEGSLLDKLQFERDVIFVVAATNSEDVTELNRPRIGAPADSINSLVVGSVDYDDNPADYSRKGTVLSFFNKPDLSYYGGVNSGEMKVFSPVLGVVNGYGTSLAAPWIARKLAYMIHVLHLNREISKALLIHSAAKWNVEYKHLPLKGFGVVPIHIDEIINSPSDEIRFIFSGVSDEYQVYNYSIPVPIVKEKYPYIASATMCYFPKCSRLQGVDYTGTELSFSFGRVCLTKKNAPTIDSIDGNQQGKKGIYSGNEKSVRDNYRKWDNVKHIYDRIAKNKNRARDIKLGKWGFIVTNTSRLSSLHEKTSFGVVVSLKAIDGISRIDSFIQNCFPNGWFVTPIVAANQVEIYNKAEETVQFN